MNVKFSARFFAMACGVVLLAQGLVAQTTTQLFGPVDVAASNPSASYYTPYSFNTSTLNLTCPATGITANLSGPAGGNLLVDNNIIVTVTPASEPAQAAVNVCPVTDELGPTGLYYQNCFTSGYGGPASGGSLTGDDPDTLVGSGGVAPISIVSPILPTLDPSGSSENLPAPLSPPIGLVPGAQSVTIALDDEGGEVASSSIFLNTNCTVGGVSSGTITGNPITSNSLVQTFTFHSNTGTNAQPEQTVILTYDVSQVNNLVTGATPQTTDAPLALADFQTKYAPKTSFATSSCLIHTGEVLSDGVTPACKLYTLQCINPNDGTLSGANCPVSDLANEGVTDFFDGPQFTMQNIYTPYGVFHEGIGFLMASDDWSPTNGGPCSFEEAAGTPVANQPCPQNLLISFSGTGPFAGKGLTTNPNSTFISIAGVPEDHTSVVVAGELPDFWVNSKSPKVYFATQAPNLSKGAYVLNSANKPVTLTTASSYVPAPIGSVTYGISPASGPLPMPANEPIIGDLTLTPASPCPTTLPTSPTEPNFVPGPVQITFPADGQYLLHYYAQDCAGTQELQFVLNPANVLNPAPYWTTNFYTFPINIDTTAPKVVALTLPTPPAGGSYKLNSVVNASYECTDATTGSGLVLCGTYVYAPQSTYDTGSVHMLTSRINTSSVGTGKTYTVYAVDGAGNYSSTKSITYSVSR